MPFASVVMLEKLALLKIALCKAPALRSASSASLRAVISACSWTFDESGGWFMPEIDSAFTGSHKWCGEHRKTLIVETKGEIRRDSRPHSAGPGFGVEV